MANSHDSAVASYYRVGIEVLFNIHSGARDTSTAKPTTRCFIKVDDLRAVVIVGDTAIFKQAVEHHWGYATLLHAHTCVVGTVAYLHGTPPFSSDEIVRLHAVVAHSMSLLSAPCLFGRTRPNVEHTGHPWLS